MRGCHNTQHSVFGFQRAPITNGRVRSRFSTLIERYYYSAAMSSLLGQKDCHSKAQADKPRRLSQRGLSLNRYL